MNKIKLFIFLLSFGLVSSTSFAEDGEEDDGGAHGRTMVMIQLHARKANSVKNMAMRNADTTACTILRHVHGCPGDIPVHSHSKQARAGRLRVVVVVAAVVGSSAAACGDEVAVIAAAPSK